MKALKIAAAVAVSAFAVMLMPLSAKAAPEVMPDGMTFDAEFYAATYPDVVALVGDNKMALYSHFVAFGAKEGRLPFAGASADNMQMMNLDAFNPMYYAERYPDVVAVLGHDSALLEQHYLTAGKAEGRFANAAQEAAAIEKAKADRAAKEAAARELEKNSPLRQAEKAVDIINQTRVDHGKVKIEISYAVVNAAFVRANEVTDKPSDTRPNGTEFKTVFLEKGINLNVDEAYEYYVCGIGTAEEAASYFLHANVAREKLINENFRKIGVGYAFDAGERGGCWVLLLVK